MKTVRGYYYDGRKARQHAVAVTREGESLFLRGDDVDVSYPCDGVEVTSRVGDNRRLLRFTDGSQCEVVNAFDLEGLLGLEEKGGGQRLVGRLERSMVLSLLALGLTVLLIVLFIKYVIPATARKVAFAIPPATESALGGETLAILDRMVFGKSKLDPGKQQEVTHLFRQLQGAVPGGKDYRLEFRESKQLGANALALPAGIIVLTDDLVLLARNQGELAGVLAHEAGHERYRHAMRHVLQNSGTGLLIAALTGDIVSITSLSAALPTALIDARYSREFEYEADDAAVKWMKEQGMAPQQYADMLARLQSAHEKKRDGQAVKQQRRSFMDLFASHPDTDERIRRITRKESVVK